MTNRPAHSENCSYQKGHTLAISRRITSLIMLALGFALVPLSAMAQFEPTPYRSSPLSSTDPELPDLPKLPTFLNRPIQDDLPRVTPLRSPDIAESYEEPVMNPPLGYAGRSTIIPTQPRTSADAIAVRLVKFN